VEAKVNMFSASGIRVDSLQVLGEAYKPYKVLYNFPSNNLWAVQLKMSVRAYGALQRLENIRYVFNNRRLYPIQQVSQA
jgi:hypothetical protein